jgi:hypothetical protein
MLDEREGCGWLGDDRQAESFSRCSVTRGNLRPAAKVGAWPEVVTSRRRVDAHQSSHSH